jgi:very-short-patch-repair endonuclease
MRDSDEDSEALRRMNGMLNYVEQLIRLDESVVKSINQHKLADGTQFIIHQHDLEELPGFHFDQGDDSGPIWLRIERLVRSQPPEVDEVCKEWITVSNNPTKTCTVKTVIQKRVSKTDMERMISEGLVLSEECQPSLQPEPDKSGKPQFYDIKLELKKRPAIEEAINVYLAERWARWSVQELPVWRSIEVYRKFFTVAQLLASGNLDQSELVWGIGLSKWLKAGTDLELPILLRSVEIEVLEEKKAEILIRPRDTPCRLELRAFQQLAPTEFNLAEKAAKQTLRIVENSEPDGVSPFRAESFESVLKICAGSDSDGMYLPDHQTLPPSEPVPSGKEGALVVSDRFVIFARRRAMSVVINDIERLKEEIANTEKTDKRLSIEGAARTLVMGPHTANEGFHIPLGPIGTMDVDSFGPETEPDHDHADLYFPKPFNDDQVEIVRRLEKSDGVVVQGPPGTGKTHTIANVISHMLAVGKRVLIISHGESALSVIRDQLPQQIRDLAISVTTSERDGERQVEKAVSLMLNIINDYTSNPSAPKRRIANIEKQILADRAKLKEIDAAIGAIAKTHLSSVPGSEETPLELALKLVSNREAHAWFPDRPRNSVAQSKINGKLIDEALAAKENLSDDLQYIDLDLQKIGRLPDPQKIELWRGDLLQARGLDTSSEYAKLAQRLMAKLGPQTTTELHQRIRELLIAWQNVSQENWSVTLVHLGIESTSHFETARAQLGILANQIWQIGERSQSFIARRVTLPDDLPHGQVLSDILGDLVKGNNPFGLLSFKLNKYKPKIDKILVNEKQPQNVGDWQHVSNYISLNSELTDFHAEFKNTCSALDVPFHIEELKLSDVGRLRKLLAEALDLPQEVAHLVFDLTSVLEDHNLVASITSNFEALNSFSAAITSRLSYTRLVAVRNNVKVIKEVLPPPELSAFAGFHFVLENIENPEVSDDELLKTWSDSLDNLERLLSLQPAFDLIQDAHLELAGAYVPKLAKAIKQIDPDTKGYFKAHWRESWDWWVLFNYVDSIGDAKRLSVLHTDRVETEKRLRDNFAELVRERAFFALAQMPGPAMSALKAFSGIVKKIGRGTGKRAPLLRRELRVAMHKCYDAVPCWIMPAWRVSEQLPSVVGAFDLVILDEASQSDARELPALLRGKKMLIVGDDRQVSPTAAFIKQDDIERLRLNYLDHLPFPTHLLPGSSIYDLASVMFPNTFVMLKEHFRCVEPIIRFSMQFYNEPLVPLRIPTAKERLDPPLIDILIKDGERHSKGKKINVREAEVIVEEISKTIKDPRTSQVQASEPRPRTIGVISLIGHDQARYIQQKLIERLGESTFVKHKIICGNSAMMQGNERDIVFLSMIADSRSRVGAQTSEQYMQAYNVALSRARDRMVLVRSIEFERLNPNDLKAKVIEHFKNPMPSILAANDELIEKCQSNFERSIFERLTKLGYFVQPQVGSLGYSIDLVVEGSNGQRLAIECDGDQYHGPDRWADDMRRQRTLERVGWVFWRVLGSTYTLDPEGVIADLVQTLGKQGIVPDGKSPSEFRWTEHRVIEAKSITELETNASDVQLDLEQLAVSSDEAVAVGDDVVVMYLDQPNAKPITYLIVESESDQQSGKLNINSPLAKRLSEADVGDEIVLEAESGSQRILFSAKRSAGESIMAAA